MRIILFTPPSDQKILDHTKTMTARFWLQNPPDIGDLIRAQTGRSKDTSFAILKVTGVWQWDGQMDGNIFTDTGMFRSQIAKKEGFKDWESFYSAYYELNSHKWNNGKRSHYFIEFKLVRDFLDPNHHIYY